MILARPVNLGRLSAALGIPLFQNGDDLLTYDGMDAAPLPAGYEAQIAAEQDAYAADLLAPPLDPVQAIVQAVLSAPDCPPGVRAAILAAQQAQAGQA